MGLYSLFVIIVMMLAAIVVTQEPNGDSEIGKAVPKRRNNGYVARGQGESLATTAGPLRK